MTQEKVLSPQIFMDATLVGLLLEHRQFFFFFSKIHNDYKFFFITKKKALR